MKSLASVSVAAGTASLVIAAVCFIQPRGVPVWSPPPVAPAGMHDYAGTTIDVPATTQVIALVVGITLIVTGLNARWWREHDAGDGPPRR